MATVKVKLRPSSVEGKAGVIFYQITHNCKIQQITTKLRVQLADWDSDKGQPTSSAPNCSMIQNRMESDVALLKRVIADLEESGTDYSAADVVRRYQSPQSHISVLDYMRTQIAQLRAANKLGTAQNYDKMMHSFEAFLRAVKLPLSVLTERVIAEYNAFLVRRGLVRNSVSFYMRMLRAVYNKAVRQKLIEQTNPFANVYTGIDHTRKRAVSESVIAQLYRLDLPESSPLALTRNLFIFSYCTRGMAFVDIAYLRKSNLQNRMICYAHCKKGQLSSVCIEPAIQRIIDRYASEQSPYLLPILTSLDAGEAYEQYWAALNTHNRLLKRLSRLLSDGCLLTSYTSRYGWAVAKNTMCRFRSSVPACDILQNR